jgi:hypothetical protein
MMLSKLLKIIHVDELAQREKNKATLQFKIIEMRL